MQQESTALTSLRRYDEAVPYFYESIRVNPQNEVAYVNLGYNYLRRNDCGDAVFFFEKALEARPGYPAAENGVDYCVRHAGKGVGP